MKSLLQLIQDYRSGIKNADEEILKRMEPLIKGYASRIHCMDRDDATQELYLTLLKTLPYLNNENFSEGKCVKYMQTAIENRYKALCRYHLSEPEKEDFDSCSLTLSADNSFDETSINPFLSVAISQYSVLPVTLYSFRATAIAPAFPVR